MRISDWSSDVCSSDLKPLLLILTDFTLFFIGFQAIHAIAPHVAHGDARLFRILGRKLRQFLASLLRQIGDWQADVLPIGDGIETRSEEHTSELQSLMRISYAVFCLTKKNANRLIQL